MIAALSFSPLSSNLIFFLPLHFFWDIILTAQNSDPNLSVSGSSLLLLQNMQLLFKHIYIIKALIISEIYTFFRKILLFSRNYDKNNSEKQQEGFLWQIGTDL